MTMSIPEYQEIGKADGNMLQKVLPKLFIPVVLILVGASSYGLGRLSTIYEKREPIEIRNENVASVVATENIIETATSSNKVETGTYVGSKNSKVYHLPWCSGAQRITESNKIWFASKEEAEKAGYRPAQNCKGI